jgi:hypothetical protein
MSDDGVTLTVADRYWVLHEAVIGGMLVRCYNHDIDPAEAIALMVEHSDTQEVTPRGEADHSEA